MKLGNSNDIVELSMIMIVSSQRSPRIRLGSRVTDDLSFVNGPSPLIMNYSLTN